MHKIGFLFLFFVIKFSFSQSYGVAEREIETSFNKNSSLLEMIDGSTVLLEGDPKIVGFDLKIFDLKHEKTIGAKIKIQNLKYFTDMYLLSFIEVNKRAVLFYTTFKNDTVYHNRLTIEPHSGEYKNEILFSKHTEALVFLYMETIFFKVVEDQKHDRYAIINGYKKTEDDFEVKVLVYDKSGLKVLANQTYTYNDHFRIDLLDATLDNDNLYLCLNKRSRNKESESKGFFNPTQVNYIPQSKVYVYKYNIYNSSKEQISLDLTPFMYSIKAQLVLDTKNGMLNLLLCAINNEDLYARIPKTLNLFYKFSTMDLNTKLKKEITNGYAYSNFMARYPGTKISKTHFTNFPQYFFTDSMGNTALVSQTVYIDYDKPDDVFADLVQKEFAITRYNSEMDAQSVTFLPYYYNAGGDGRLEGFSFACNNNIYYRGLQTQGTDIEPYHFTTFEVEQKIVLIQNLHPENVNAMGASYSLNKDERPVQPAIMMSGKHSHLIEPIFKDEQHKKVKLNVNISSFNKKTKTFVTLANIGKNRRLIWLKFD